MGRHGFFRVSPIDEDHRKVDRATVRRVVGTFRPYKGKVGLVGLMIGVTSGLGVINPLMIVLVFDDALFGPNGVCQGQPCPNLPLLYLYVGIMIAVPIVTSIIGIGQTYLTNVVGLNVMQDLRNRLYQHLQAMPLRFFTTTRTGEIQSRLANDVGGVQSVVTDTASTVLSNVVTIISTIIAMLLISLPLTILSLLLIPLFLWLTVKVGRARREVATNTQRTLADMTTITEETLSVSGILLSKAFGRQRFESDRFRGENERLTGFLLRQTMIGRSFFALVGTFFSITPALVYLVAGWVNSNAGRTSSRRGCSSASPRCSRGSSSRSARCCRSRPRCSPRSRCSIGSSSTWTCRTRSRTRRMPCAIHDVTGRVRLRDVRFRYEEPPPEERGGIPVSPDASPLGDDDPVPREWTLDGVDLDIRPGQLAALVGPSGAGKTTVTYLVPRLYDVQEGAVEIDDLDVRKITLESLGEAIGVVTQETYLFHDTVRRNLHYGQAGRDRRGADRRREAANIHDRIAELPEGYDTVVGERGYKLSGGEKQRLAIARVVLKDPRILILDEATSSLDTTSERLVQSALEPLMKGRTTIAIAHRLSTILSADVIFVLDRGRIVERGTHDELLANGAACTRSSTSSSSAAASSRPSSRTA